MRTFLFTMVLFAAMTAGSGAGEARRVRIGLSRSPASLPALRVMESGALADRAVFTVDVWTAPEQLLAMAQSGGHDLFTLPLTLAAILHNRGVGVRMTNVNTWGGVFFLARDPDLAEWKGLSGKTVYLPPRGSPPDVLSRFFLARAGVKPEDAELTNLSVLEIAHLLKAGRIQYATVIEPQTSMAMEGDARVRVVFDFEEEWRRIFGRAGGLPSLGFGGNAAFIEENGALIREFENAYAEATEWVLRNPDEAGMLAERHLNLPATTVAKAVPRMGLRYRRAAEAQPELRRFYEVFLEFSPNAIGGAIPDETLYWK